MAQDDDAFKVLPLWARLRLAHDFADDDEKKRIEKLADEILEKHPDIKKVVEIPALAEGESLTTTERGYCIASLMGGGCAHIAQCASCMTACQHIKLSCITSCQNSCQHILQHSCQQFLQTSCQVSCQALLEHCQHSCMIACLSTVKCTPTTMCNDLTMGGGGCNVFMGGPDPGPGIPIPTKTKTTQIQKKRRVR